MSRMSMRAVLLGPPNAGKGMAGEYLYKTADIISVSTGQLLRAEVASGSEVGRRLKEELDKGHFAPDEIVVSLVSDFLRQYDSFTLDGFPRNVQQAEYLEKELAKLGKPLSMVIFLSVPDEVIVERALARLTCSNCRRVTSTRLTDSLICEVCGGRLFRRSDDTEVTVRERIEIYRQQTEPLIAFYRTRRLLREVNADVTLPELYEELTRLVSSIKEMTATG